MSYDLDTSSMRGVTSGTFKASTEKTYDVDSSSMRGFVSEAPAVVAPAARQSTYTEDLSSAYVAGDLRLER